MNKIAIKFLLVGDNFMPGQTRFTYSACGPFTNRERFQDLEEQVI